MARNRKYQSAAIRFGPALKAFLLCLLIGGSGVGYVWQKDQIAQLGRQIDRREVRLRGLVRYNEELKKQLGSMRSPPYLQWRIQQLGLGLVPPQPTQVLRLTEPARDLPQPESEPRYAAPYPMKAEPQG